MRKRIHWCIALALPLLVLTGERCSGQLFGGGGLLGGGGFGGGRPLLGGGGFRGGAPILRGPAISRPIARPARPIISRPAISRPIFGGTGPGISQLPSGPSRPLLGSGPGIGSRPAIGGGPIVGRPPAAGPLPGRPLGGDRPLVGGLPAMANRPILGRPNLPGFVRPSQPVTRDRLNDFLNNPPTASRPIASQLPAAPIGGDRPILGGGDRPLVPEGNRPILGDRPIVDHPIMPNLGEEVLRDEIRNEIIARRVKRAVHVRDRIRDLYYRENHPFAYWWHHMWTNHPVWSWWGSTAPLRWATWSSVGGWCGYSGSYAQPVSYEYTDQGVYANGQQVQADDQYAQQALDLARAGAELLKQKVDAQQADSLEWLPLGVYSLSDKQDGDPTLFLQLAISKESIVAGTFFNAQTNENVSVQGGADRESTRLAVTIGDKEDTVVETGLYNVTQEQSSAIVYYEDGTSQNMLLVRLPEPTDQQPQ